MSDYHSSHNEKPSSRESCGELSTSYNCVPSSLTSRLPPNPPLGLLLAGNVIALPNSTQPVQTTLLRKCLDKMTSTIGIPIKLLHEAAVRRTFCFPLLYLSPGTFIWFYALCFLILLLCKGFVLIICLTGSYCHRRVDHGPSLPRKIGRCRR